MGDSEVVFIGGTGRCGTNVTTALIGQHADAFAMPFEYRITIDPDGLVDFYRSVEASWSPFIFDRKLRRLHALLKLVEKRGFFRWPLGKLVESFDRRGRFITPTSYHAWELREWFPDYGERVDDLVAELRDFDFQGTWPGAGSHRFGNRIWFSSSRTKEELAKILGSFLDDCIGALLRQRGKSVFVEDNTWNMLHAGALHELVPHAKFIHVFRDPRDVVASMIRQRWCPDSLPEAIQYYKALLDRSLMMAARLPEELLMPLRFESLVRDTARVSREIAEFLGLEWSPEMASIDLGRAHIGRWKADFSSREREFLLSQLGDELSTLGYE